MLKTCLALEEVHQDDATLNKQIVKNKDHHVSIEILQSFSINSIQLLGDAQVEEKIDLLCITITVSLFAKKLLVVAPPTRDLRLLVTTYVCNCMSCGCRIPGWLCSTSSLLGLALLLVKFLGLPEPGKVWYLHEVCNKSSLVKAMCVNVAVPLCTASTGLQNCHDQCTSCFFYPRMSSTMYYCTWSSQKQVSFAVSSSCLKFMTTNFQRRHCVPSLGHSSNFRCCRESIPSSLPHLCSALDLS